MFKLSRTKAVQEENGKLVLMKCDHQGLKVTDTIELDEHELRQVIEFSYNALGVPSQDPFPFD